MTGSIVFSVVVLGLVLCGVGIGLMCHNACQSARLLELRCSLELEQLKSLLSSRHLILSHLRDLLPEQQEGGSDSRQLQKPLQRAERCLQRLDPVNPAQSELFALQSVEQNLSDVARTCRNELQATTSESQYHVLSSCLDGLDKKTDEILDALSTYNAAAITYGSFLSNSRIARRYFQCRYEVLELIAFDSEQTSGSDVTGEHVKN